MGQVKGKSGEKRVLGDGQPAAERKRGHGGRRRGAGRKRSASSGVSHGRRPDIGGEVPGTVTLKIANIGEWGGNMRDPLTLEVILACFEVAKERFGMRICHYTVQTNHIHLIVEADDRECFLRGMRGLTTRLAKNLNKHWDRKGKLFTDRYHSERIKDGNHVQNSIVYVGNNDLKHDSAYTITPFDPCSSAAAFKGWVEGDLRQYEMPEQFAFALAPPVATPRSGMLTDTWFYSRWMIRPSIQQVPRGGDPTQQRRLVRRA